jgi:hypothetical protein
MIDHLPWIGAAYSTGINGQKIAIVGYSHWSDESDNEGAQATRECIQNVISSDWKIRFFTALRNYFGYVDHGAFWNKIIFFNYLPNCVGNGEQRFEHGTEEQREYAKERFKRIVGEERPQKVLVFTSRRWAFPEVDCTSLSPSNFPSFSYGQYHVGDHTALIFFLRHPQGAKKTLMKSAVEYILDMTI